MNPGAIMEQVLTALAQNAATLRSVVDWLWIKANLQAGLEPLRRHARASRHSRHPAMHRMQKFQMHPLVAMQTTGDNRINASARGDAPSAHPIVQASSVIGKRSVRIWTSPKLPKG
ncbi:MAG: hypothetical protein ACFLMY_09835 [Candidatus Brachytrichaceae bacterium NZ_4S206]